MQKFMLYLRKTTKKHYNPVGDMQRSTFLIGNYHYILYHLLKKKIYEDLNYIQSRIILFVGSMKKFDQKFRIKTRMDESEDNVKRKILSLILKSIKSFVIYLLSAVSHNCICCSFVLFHFCC